MNPLIILVALVVGLFTWYLVVCLRSGEFKYRSGGRYGPVTYPRVRRSEQPVPFWILALFHAGVILYVASMAWEL